jgi:hypothetical protein
MIRADKRAVWIGRERENIVPSINRISIPVSMRFSGASILAVISGWTA